MNIKPAIVIPLLLLSHLISFNSHGAAASKTQTAILAGGCFWCIESDYEKLKGVTDVVSGYIGGHIKKPTYEQVSSGKSGHIEAVKITYDPEVISYSQILDYFWRHVDPTRNDGQFCDTGTQYRPAIFYQNVRQKDLALKSTEKTRKIKPFKAPLKVDLIKASEFYLAEQYHQDYYKKNPVRYRFYRYNCGRDKRVKELWGSK